METAATKSSPLNEAIALPNGARFYHCALQVNPFVYQNRHNKNNDFETEAEYNEAIIAACIEKPCKHSKFSKTTTTNT